MEDPPSSSRLPGAQAATMPRVRIPTCLAEPAGRKDERAFASWVATLPAIVPDLVERWGLTVGDPYEPGGYCSWVAPARDAAGRELVLKVGWRHPEAEHEADGLRVWDGDGAARLHAAHNLDHPSALLLERCTPGMPLSSAVPPAEADVVVASLLRRLWRPPQAGHPFRPLHHMCDMWAAEFEAGPPARIDPGLAGAGISLLRSLPRDSTEQVLLCTDLHAENVLAAQREPWLAIDPKPYVGDPCYDPTQHMFNDNDRLQADPRRFADRMAGLLDVDAERVRLWLFARCVHESPRRPLLGDVAGRLAP